MGHAWRATVAVAFAVATLAPDWYFEPDEEWLAAATLLIPFVAGLLIGRWWALALVPPLMVAWVLIDGTGELSTGFVIAASVIIEGGAMLLGIVLHRVVRPVVERLPPRVASRWMAAAGAVLAAAAALGHFSTALDSRSVGWSIADEREGSYRPWSCGSERQRRFVCHELSGDNVPFAVERMGRRCWRVRRTVTTQGGRAGTIALSGCYDGWDRLERHLGLGPRGDND